MFHIEDGGGRHLEFREMLNVAQVATKLIWLSLPWALGRKGSKVRKTSLLVHSLSTDKTLVLPSRGTPRTLGTLRPQANVLEISEQ